MQISKKSIMADFYGLIGFFVEHIELDLCVKFQVNRTYGVRGVAFPKNNFKSLITAPPSGQPGSYFNRSWCTSFPVIGPSFGFLAYSSSREFELKRQTTNNNNNNNNKYSRKRQSPGSNLLRPKPATPTLAGHGRRQRPLRS